MFHESEDQIESAASGRSTVTIWGRKVAIAVRARQKGWVHLAKRTIRPSRELVLLVLVRTASAADRVHQPRENVRTDNYRPDHL